MLAELIASLKELSKIMLAQEEVSKTFCKETEKQGTY